MKKLLLLLFFLIITSGCSHVISKVNLEKIDKTISTSELMKEPGKYKGKMVLLGGDIVASINRKNGTYIEVVQKNLNSFGRPLKRDETLGRFIVFHDGYLDSAIYARGRRLTVAGEVMGVKTQLMGEIEYNYPLIKVKELRLIDTNKSPAFSFGIGISGTF